MAMRWREKIVRDRRCEVKAEGEEGRGGEEGEGERRVGGSGSARWKR